MGRRGPVPSPRAKIRILNGIEEQHSTPSLPSCPGWVSEAGQAEWSQVILDLGGLVTEIDRNTLAVYCQTLADYKENIQILLGEGWLVESRYDRGPVKNPRSQIIRELRESLLAYAKELGLTPNARSKVKSVEESKVDPLGAFASAKDDPPTGEASSG